MARRTKTLEVHEVMTERELSRCIISAAKECGFLVYHTFLSRWSEAGFPDLVLLKPPRIIFAELKGPKGKLKEAQKIWLEQLKQVPNLEVYLWKPENVEEVYKLLIQAPPPKVIALAKPPFSNSSSHAFFISP